MVLPNGLSGFDFISLRVSSLGTFLLLLLLKTISTPGGISSEYIAIPFKYLLPLTPIRTCAYLDSPKSKSSTPLRSSIRPSLSCPPSSEYRTCTLSGSISFGGLIPCIVSPPSSDHSSNERISYLCLLASLRSGSLVNTLMVVHLLGSLICRT